LLRFCQWLKRYYDINIGKNGHPDYNPEARRQGQIIPGEFTSPKKSPNPVSHSPIGKSITKSSSSSVCKLF
jgi:hypothetical protein